MPSDFLRFSAYGAVPKALSFQLPFYFLFKVKQDAKTPETVSFLNLWLLRVLFNSFFCFLFFISSDQRLTGGCGARLADQSGSISEDGSSSFRLENARATPNDVEHSLSCLSGGGADKWW